jgi:hypothetical protein
LSFGAGFGRSTGFKTSGGPKEEISIAIIYLEGSVPERLANFRSVLLVRLDFAAEMRDSFTQSDASVPGVTTFWFRGA